MKAESNALLWICDAAAEPDLIGYLGLRCHHIGYAIPGWLHHVSSEMERIAETVAE